MLKKMAVALSLPVLFVAVQGCLSDPVSVSGGGGMEVRLHVSGGFAGADYTLVLDGRSRSLVGESCVSLCDFQAGEILQNLTTEQVDYVWGLFQDAGVLALDGEDFGTQCCDQFHFDLDYSDPRGRSRVKGSSEALPQALNVALGTVLGMGSGTVPLIVDFLTNPSSWPNDAFRIESAAVVGHNLQLTLSYGGGCKTHEVKALAWGGWMESFPVQVRLFLSHEDFDDPCDAWITRDFSFDLVPLKLAYQESYGVGQPGETTLKLLLEDPILASPQGARVLEYKF
jgi:hypothetical protein